MNTTQKGNDFEKRFYDLLVQTVQSKNFRLNIDGDRLITIQPEGSLIYRHKRYPTKWNSTSDIDASVDCDAIPLTVIIECKNYSKPVDIGELNELKGRLDGLNIQHAKGILVTSGKFQSGVIDAARYHNIALIRVSNNNTLEWDAYRLGQKNKLSCNDAILKLTSDESSTVVLDHYATYSSVCDYISQILNIIPEQIKRAIPFLPDERIKKETLDFLGDYDFNGAITNDYIEAQAKRYGVTINMHSDADGYLGRYNFADRSVHIADSLNEDIHRQRFTLGHEIGHAILHHHTLSNLFNCALDNDFFNQNAIWCRWLETQANKFASYLLIPDNTLIRNLIAIKLELGIQLYQRFYMDKQRCNISTCNAAINKLSQIFNVSHEVAKLRLINSNHLVVEDSNYFRI
jgi:Zn-dependent peptidase ImmA (M78 family)